MPGFGRFMLRARRASVAALAVSVPLVTATVPAAATPAPAAAPVVHAGASPADFGPGAAASPDVLLDGWGDGAGYHLQVAREKSGFAWQSLALLRPQGLDDSSWTGYQCVSGDGRYAAVAILPQSAVNLSAARDHGAFAYSVDLTSGAVHPVARGVGLKYHSPGCGTGRDAVFSLNLGVDQEKTELLTTDLATGAITAKSTVDGQVTSAVPSGEGVIGVAGASLVAVAGPGQAKRGAALDAPAYDLRPSAAGGVDFLTLKPGAPTATVRHEKAGAVRTLASGPASAVHLFPGRGGHAVLTGVDRVEPGSGLKSVRTSPLPHGVTATSLDGDAALGPDADPAREVPVVLATGSGVLLSRPRPDTAAASTTAVSPVVPDGVGAAPVANMPAGKPQPQGDAAPAAVQPKAQKLTTTAAQTPTCSVPRLDRARQVPQPSPAQVGWAVQMAEQNLLTGSLGRPAGFDNLGLVAYASNSDFPKIALKHPAGDSWDSVPRSVMQAIMAQESNWSQASWHSLPGMTGDPLIADYYGAGGDIVSMNYAGADCGYGVAQVTTGMRAGDHSSYSVNGQTKIAVDYEENIAAGLQILESTWNQLYDAGILANNGNPRYLENWYFAAWAYNTGIQPTKAYNPTGCVPGPSCTGPDGTWGLGWTNNPANLDYPPNRDPFLQDTYDDAKHPASWPYEERVMGWMASPIIRGGTRAYAKPTYHGGSTWLKIPPTTAFCGTDNHCDPNATNPSNPGASHCLLDDFECWWHQPVSWIPDCATTCATSEYTAGAGSTEPGVADPHPPTCTLVSDVVPSGPAGPPIIVDEQTTPGLNLVGCAPSNWSSDGTFTYSYGTNSAGDPIGAIDTHQLGAGFGGRILFTHTEDGSNPALINTGTWTPNLPKLQYYKIKIHIPALGASATNVVYQINPGGGASPWKIRVNQHWDSEEWVTIGTFAMQNGGNVQLSNTSTAVGSDGDLLNYDVGYDALAFLPMGGTPGTPIGGPPGIIDAPKGSNPAFVQCGCVRRTAGDPVDTSTGYFGDEFTDLTTPGRGAALNFTRSYASALADPNGPNKTYAADGPFGYGWTFSYNLSAATDGTTGNVTVRQEDGSAITFVNSSGTYAPSAPRYDAALVKSGSSYVYTRRGKDVFTFDAATGRLTAETDPAGTKANPPYATNLAYDGAGHLATITDPAQRRYTLAWTGNHITGLSDTAGRQVTYGYNAAGDLTDVYGVGTTRTPSLKDDDHLVYGYAAGTHLMTSMRSPANFGSTATPDPVTSMVYDGAERVLTQTDPTGKTTTFTYGPDGGLQAGQTQVTDPGGHKTIYTYSNGLLVSETRGAGTADAGTWTYTYDPVTLGVSTLSDPNGHVQTFSYDDHGNRISASDAAGFATAYRYDDHGNLLSSIDPRGVQTVNGYDETGHVPASAAGEHVLTSTTVTQLGQSAEVKDGNPSAAVTRAENFYYDDAAHPDDRTRAVDAEGRTTTSTFDGFGDLTSRVDGAGAKTQAAYDTGRGWPVTSVSPAGSAAGVGANCAPPQRGCTVIGHDAWGNVTDIKDAFGHSTTSVYDADGNQLGTTDQNNRKTTLVHDPMGRLVRTVRPDGVTTVTDYNPDGTIADELDGANHKTSYGYDGQGRRTGRTDPGNRATTGHFDGAGNLLTSTDPAGRVTTYGYDPANRVTSAQYSDGTTPGATFAYDSAGTRVSMTDATGTTKTDVDAFGEVVGITRGSGAHVGYGYDRTGRATSITYPGGAAQTVTQTFDAAGRLATVTDWNSNKTTFGYGDDGNLHTTTYPNGTVVTNGFDDTDTLTSSTLSAGTTTVASLVFGRDNAHQLSSSTPAGLPGAAKTFGYSPREQLQSATSGGVATGYAVDAADNPTGLGAATQAFDASDRLCWALPSGTVTAPACDTAPAGATKYGFDTQGNRTSATPATGAATTYGYDQANRLTSVSGTASYRYDGDGLRTAKTAGTTTTAFTYGAGSVPNLLSDGATSYVYGPGGAPIEQIGGGTTLWYFHDQIGSTRARVDAAGHVAGAYAYGEYGAGTHTGTASTPLRFTGQYTDDETGFVYLRARYLDPATAQFLSVDPMVNATHTPYAYVNGDPLNDTDPTGLCGFWCKVGIGAAIVGTAACIIIEPCGLVEGGAVAVAGGAAAIGGGAVTFVGGSVVAAGAAAGAIGGAAVAMATNPSSSSSSSSNSGNSNSGEASAESSRQKSINSFQRLIREHQQKLEEYRNNPDAFDNKGILQGQSPEIRERIISGRIKHLETEIRGFQEQLNKLLGNCPG